MTMYKYEEFPATLGSTMSSVPDSNPTSSMPSTPYPHDSSILGLAYKIYALGSKRFAKNIVSNGQNTSLWYDRWHPLGILADVFPFRVIYDSATGSNATVADVTVDNEWRCPPARSDDFVEIKAALCVSILPNSDVADRVVYIGSKNGLFQQHDAGNLAAKGESLRASNWNGSATT
ncbi:uncharacterized protein LOC115664154 [Syzygium oleosum]|uniref:uncharacterized protein LOC115664154 n=1 Tax=Syzygium oleosum TaxID=219896 RepID=UPI0024BA5B2C|nr:uncharacterized protein LOC115664154 [Syzygium oleosum]XP_056167727.1 uncharacterized protein LOC115664154 [Syzygium oleosum]